jgi:hypothetical protein
MKTIFFVDNTHCFLLKNKNRYENDDQRIMSDNRTKYMIDLISTQSAEDTEDGENLV